MERLRRSLIVVLAVACLGFGALSLAWMLHTKPLPPVHSSFDTLPRVAVAPVELGSAEIPIVGHGTVRPKRQVSIIPQVSGQLLFAHPKLGQGAIIEKGELLFEIDPVVYQSRVRQAEAEIRGLEATLERLDQEAVSLDDRIANAQQLIEIDERDYETSRTLYEVDKVGTQRDVDLVHQKVLRSRDQLVELKSKRALMPHVTLETQAQLDAARARFSQATHDLESTRIRCPFTARVEAVGAHASQVVTAHFSIATLTDMEAFEISVGVDPRDLRWLDEAVRPDALVENNRSMERPVRVHWSLADQSFTWTGYVTRFEKVDEVTRTARLVVEIRSEDMAATVTAGSSDAHTTLSIGMFCRTELPAARLTDALLVPRHAIYDDRYVYVFEPDPNAPNKEIGRLARREIAMLRTLQDSVLVDFRGRHGTEICELRAGEQLIVSPLTRPVVGMRIGLQQGSELVTRPYTTGAFFASAIPQDVAANH